MAALQRPRRFWVLSWHTRRTVEGYLFVLPWIVGIFAFFLYPMGYAIYISLTKWQVIGASQWVGLANYRRILTDPLVRTGLKVTATYTALAVPLRLLVGFLMAFLLNQKIKGVSFFRTIYYAPSVLSGPAIAVLWGWMFNTEFGLVNYLLRMVGIPNVPWLTTREWVMGFFVIMALWTVGDTIILYLAGLQGIPTEYYEAAEVDGADRVQRLRYVTLPMLSPVIFYSLVTSIIGSFQVWVGAYLVTQGGPGKGSYFYYLYIYNMAFRDGWLGYAAALAWVLFIILALISFVIFRTSGAWVYYEARARGGGG